MKIATVTICIFALAGIFSSSGRAQTGDVFSSGSGTSGSTTGRTGTQGVEGNPNCPPPTINGITPKNWSCRTGTQAVPGLPAVGYGDEPPLAAQPTPSPIPYSIDAALSSIEDCWTQTFLANGRTYLRPLPLSAPSYPGSAAYNSTTKRIIYNPAILDAQAANYGAMSVTVTLAHELGHSVQDQTGRLGHELLRKNAELQADMLAGVAVRCLDASGALGAGDLGAAVWGRYVKGDTATTPAFARQAHGTPAERADAFTDGYIRGLPPGFFNAPMLGY